MASQRAQILFAAIATAMAALLAILFSLVILPFLPPLQPLAIQLLYRLGEALAFLACTTAIAIAIFSSQRKQAGTKKPSLEHHPLALIFGEPGYGEAEDYTEEADEGKQQQQQEKKKMTMRKERWDDEDGNAEDLRQGRATEAMVGALLQKAVMGASRRGNLPASKEESSLDSEVKAASHAVQRKLHRRSSSLDDSINYEPEPEAEAAGDGAMEGTLINNGSDKSPLKRVSISMDSSSFSPSSSDHSPHGELQKEEQAGIQPQPICAMSPNELTRQADAFIAKFKEQMRLQRLESFQRFRRRVP